MKDMRSVGKMDIRLVCSVWLLTNLVKRFLVHSHTHKHTHNQAVLAYQCDISGIGARSLTLSGELLLMLCDRSLPAGMGRRTVAMCVCVRWQCGSSPSREITDKPYGKITIRMTSIRDRVEWVCWRVRFECVSVCMLHQTSACHM